MSNESLGSLEKVWRIDAEESVGLASLQRFFEPRVKTVSANETPFALLTAAKREKRKRARDYHTRYRALIMYGNGRDAERNASTRFSDGCKAEGGCVR